MNAKQLKTLAENMKIFCEYERTCSGCPGNVHINEFNGSLCDISEHSDNRQQDVAMILEAVKNRRIDEKN